MIGVSTEVLGSVGYLTLTKPATLNAITSDMVGELHNGLQEHERNAQVGVIVLQSTSETAFCAGGDMKQIRQWVIEGDKRSIKHFFTQEYALNLAIAECSKPYISLIDGIAMGGGLGLSVHGQFVVVTEQAVMAMPESRIGFFPDVGASHFLQNLPYNCGKWLALTAAPVKGQQTVQVGLATHHIQRNHLSTLLTRLEMMETEDVNSSQLMIQNCLDSFSEKTIDEQFNSELERRKEWFSGNDIESIKKGLNDASHESKDAERLATLLKKGSPYSYEITLSLLEKTKGMTLENCLTVELELAMQAAFHPDLVEGIRAVLVDKDHEASWA